MMKRLSLTMMLMLVIVAILVLVNNVMVVNAFVGVPSSFVGPRALHRPLFGEATTKESTSTAGSTIAPVALASESTSSSSSASSFDYALIFDCDGVIIETEELHRLAYNAAFESAELSVNGQPVVWTEEYYDILQNTVGGGVGKMLYHFRNTTGGQFPQSNLLDEIPTDPEQQVKLVELLQADKTEKYKTMIQNYAVARPGVLELMDQALDDPRIAVGICSASTKAAVTRVLDVILGAQRREKLDVCILGNDVSKLKPDPMIYNIAAERLGITDKEKCVVVEDSMIGLKAAKGAGMRCLITYTDSTKNEDFYAEGADAKVANLVQQGQITLDSIFEPMRQHGNQAEMLVGIKDPQ